MLNKINSKNIPYILVIANIIFQFFLFGKHINNNVFSPLHPFFGDSREYVNTTELWLKTGDFISTFSNGWRLPGYSSFMLVIYKIAALISCKALFTLRIIQLLASAFIPFFSYKALLNFSKSEKTALFGAFIICIYYPFYYFTLLISAESISLFFIAILFWQISIISVKPTGIKNILFLGLNIALLTYLKPNHILFSVPAGILLINKNDLFSGRLFRSIKIPLQLAAVIILLMLPWVVFISYQNKMFIPLATTSGVDMVIGTGVAMNPDNRDTTSLTYKYEKKHNLISDTGILQNKAGYSGAEMNKMFQAEAIEIWKKRPWVTFKYATIKIAHSMGLGFRGAKDYFSFLMIFPVLSILFFCKKFRRENKVLSILVSILFLLLCLQCFVYFGDMRLRILLFDMPAIYFLSLFIYGTYKKRISSSVF